MLIWFHSSLVTLDSRNPVIKLNCAIALRCGGSSANQTSNWTTARYRFCWIGCFFYDSTRLWSWNRI